MAGTTTNYSLPYPESTDLVASYPALGQDLAEDLDTILAAKANLSGSIVQVVSVAKTDTFTHTSTSFTNVTGLAATITPTSASNKILILGMVSGSNDAGVGMHHLGITRSGTGIALGDAAGSRYRATAFLSPADTDYNMGATIPIMWLDSPASTSALTYQIQSVVSSGTGYINRSDNDADGTISARPVSTITLMEVAA